MALTVDVTNHTVFGNKRVTVADIDFDASYPTDGEPLTAANLRLTKVELLLASPTGGLTFEYDYTNSKLKAFEQGLTTGSTAAADATTGTLVENIAGAETTHRAMGVAIDTTVRFGKLREVANAGDLSGVTDVRVIAIGF